MPKPFDLLGPVSRSSSVAPEDMLMLKRALRTIGRYPDDGDLTPYPDDALFEGVAALQGEFGLAPTGAMRPGDATVQALAAKLEGRDRPERPTDFLLGGSVGDGQENRPEDLIATQRALAALGSLPRTFDLSPGSGLSPSVVEGIRGWQRRQGLKMDGRIDPGGETEASIATGLRGVVRPRPDAEAGPVAELANPQEILPELTAEAREIAAGLRDAGVDDETLRTFERVNRMSLGRPEGRSVPLYSGRHKLVSLSPHQAAVFATQQKKLGPKLEILRTTLLGEGSLEDRLAAIELLRPRHRGPGQTPGPYEAQYFAARNAVYAVEQAIAEGVEPNREAIAAVLVPALFPETDMGKYRLENTVLPTLLEMAPVTGNVISVVEARKGLVRLRNAVTRDDWETAAHEAVSLGLNTIGALSGAGVVKAAGQRILKAAGSRSNWARSVSSNMELADALRYGRKSTDKIFDVKYEKLAQILDDALPAHVKRDKKFLTRIASQLNGEAAEVQIHRQLTDIGASRNPGHFTVKGNPKGTKTPGSKLKIRHYDDVIEHGLKGFGLFVSFKPKGPAGKVGVEIKSSRAQKTTNQIDFDHLAVKQGSVDGVDFLRVPLHKLDLQSMREVAEKFLVRGKIGGKSGRFTVAEAHKIADKFYAEGRKVSDKLLIRDYLRTIILVGLAESTDDIHQDGRRPDTHAPSLLEAP